MKQAVPSMKTGTACFVCLRVLIKLVNIKRYGEEEKNGAIGGLGTPTQSKRKKAVHACRPTSSLRSFRPSGGFWSTYRFLEWRRTPLLPRWRATNEGSPFFSSPTTMFAQTQDFSFPYGLTEVYLKYAPPSGKIMKSFTLSFFT